MIIMSKFIKRLTKGVENPQNCVVLGTGFELLPEILEVFNTVFLFSPDRPNIKSKKLVYRETFDDLGPLCDVSAVFVDLICVGQLETIASIWTKYKSLIYVEGSDVIDRTKSTMLYSQGWNAVEQQKMYHVWKPKQ